MFDKVNPLDQKFRSRGRRANLARNLRWLCGGYEVCKVCALQKGVSKSYGQLSLFSDENHFESLWRRALRATEAILAKSRICPLMSISGRFTLAGKLRRK